MTPRRARLWHLPPLLSILWAATRRGEDGPKRSRVEDVALMVRLIRRRQVRLAPGRVGPRGFLARDGERIHALYTHPGARRQGVASRLMAEAQAAVPRLELWTAQGNAPARAFYTAHGFYPARLANGAGNDEGLPDMQMIWKRSTQ